MVRSLWGESSWHAVETERRGICRSILQQVPLWQLSRGRLVTPERIPSLLRREVPVEWAAQVALVGRAAVAAVVVMVQEERAG